MLISYDDESLLDNVDLKHYPNEIVEKNYKTYSMVTFFYYEKNEVKFTQ